MNEAAFLSALHDAPNDEVTRLALADWLDEDGQTDRAALVRIVRQLRALPVMKRSKARVALEDRLNALLASGVLPAVPEVVNSIGMRLALIPPGRCRMGSPPGEKGRLLDEPLHEVAITRPFYVGVFPVTQAQYRAITDSNPSQFHAAGVGRDRVKGMTTDEFPVEQVTWNEAVRFCEQLSRRREENRAGRSYRLPSEAEWEYACRAGSASTTAFHQGKTLSVRQANIDAIPEDGDPPTETPLYRTCVVGSYPPNAFGLSDMHGNVWEWVADWYDEDHYQSEDRPARDPEGPATGDKRIVRGGSCGARWPHSRAARRHHCQPSNRVGGFGFRVVMTRT